MNLKNALLAGFGYVGMAFEDTIHPQDIEFVLQQTAGIATVKVLALHRVGDTGLATLAGAPGEIFRFQETNISISSM